MWYPNQIHIMKLSILYCLLHYNHFIMYEDSSWMPRNFNEVAKDHYFYGLINIAEGQRNFYMREYKKMLVETKRVLQLIQDELGEVN